MSAIEDFAKKCQSAKRKTDGERLREGHLTWFEGRPAPADKDFVAIEPASGTVLTFSADDVGAVETIDGSKSYRVGVKPDANIMTTTTTTHKLDDCDCGGNDDYGPPVLMRYDLNKMLGFPPWALGGGVIDPGIPGRTDPCVAAGRKTETDCWKNGGDPWTCFYHGTIERDWCELQRQRYPGSF